MKTINEDMHPTVSRILRDALNSKIMTDAEISKLCGHIAEEAVRNYEKTIGPIQSEQREGFLGSSFIRSAEASLALPRYEEGRFVVTPQFEEAIRNAAKVPTT